MNYEFESGELKELCTALAKARSEMKPPKKSEKHTQFGYYYSNCDDVIEACTLSFSANGLTIYIAQDDTPTERYLRYKILHTSGQFMGGRSFVCGAVAPNEYRKNLGWKLTEIYQLLSGVTGVVGDTDSDKQEQPQQENRQPFVNNSPKPITEKQLNLLMNKIGSSVEKEINILKQYGLTDLKQIQMKDFQDILDYVSR